MRLITFQRIGEGGARFGALLDGGARVLDFARALAHQPGGEAFARPDDVLAWLDLDGEPFRRARALYEQVAQSEERLSALGESGSVVERAAVRLLAPVPRPGKIICVGLNYRDHAIESKMAIPERPMIFSKFPTSIIGAGQPIILPSGSAQVDYEAELAVVIGRRAKAVSRERWLDVVLGYTNFNDISARDFQFADGQWQRGKSCDTFAPVGEYILTTDEMPDPHALSIRLRLNDQVMQDSTTDQLIFRVPELIEFLSRTITLEPGDIIATGTPPGVGFARQPPVFLKDGDVTQVEIEGLGTLANPVIAEELRSS